MRDEQNVNELSPLLTFNDVTSQLRVSRRWLQDFLKKHPFYLKAGNRYRFTEGHLEQLTEAMSCPSPSRGAAKFSRSAGPSEASIAMKLRAQLTRGSRKNTVRNARPSSTAKRSTASAPQSVSRGRR